MYNRRDDLPGHQDCDNHRCRDDHRRDCDNCHSCERVIRVVILSRHNSDDSSATVINHSDDTPSELPIDCPGLELMSTQFTTHLCILKIVAGLRFDFTEKHLE